MIRFAATATLALTTPISGLAARASAQSTICSSGFPVAMERVSLGDVGQELHTSHSGTGVCGAFKNCSHPTISGDGRFAAFSCDSSDVLVGYDNLGKTRQICVRDSAPGGTTELVSTPTYTIGQGPTPGEGCSEFADISGDGRFVVYESTAYNLDPDDTGDGQDVFVHDRSTRATWRLSELDTLVGLDSPSGRVRLSGNGMFAAFSTSASNATGIPGGVENVVLRPVSNTAPFGFEWINAPDAVGTIPNGPSSLPSISENGDWVAFQSYASNLSSTIADNPNSPDVFLRHRTNGELIVVSRNYTGDSTHTTSRTSQAPCLSGNGEYVCFESDASQALVGVPSAKTQIFVYRISNPEVAMVSLDDADVPSNAHCRYSVLSHDGRFVLFTSAASNIDTPPPGSAAIKFFVHDRDVSGDGTFDQSGDHCTRMISKALVGGQPAYANATCGGNCGISRDGKFAVFNCEANNLLPNNSDLNGSPTGTLPNGTALYGRDIYRVTIF